MDASPWDSQVNIPPTPTPATAFAPSNPIHAISVILYKVPKNEDAIIGIASFVNDFKIGPFVKFPSTNTFSYIFLSQHTITLFFPSTVQVNRLKGYSFNFYSLILP